MVAAIKSEWWPASNRNGGRDQVGISGRLASESARHIPDLTIVGFADVDLERAGAAAKSYGDPSARAGNDVARMMDELQPDALFDVAVPAARHGLVSLALDHGCHVLTEKPMAETLDQARELIKGPVQTEFVIRPRDQAAAIL
jgi:predicted dehydrogenase